MIWPPFPYARGRPPTSQGDDSHVVPVGCGRWRDYPPGLGKIETVLRAVKPRVDLRLYRRLYSPFRACAEVVELVDALASGASGRKPVGVRVPPSACDVSSVAATNPRSPPTHRSRRAGCALSQSPPPSRSRAP